MASIVNALEYNYVELVTHGGSTVDLTSQLQFSDYYESILSPHVTMKLALASSTDLISNLEIRGGEQVKISIKTGSGLFEKDKEYSMYVFKASDIDSKDTNQFFILNLVSREGLTNETTRCFARYDGAIKTTVEKILKDDLLTEKYKSANIEQTGNNYSFIGNTRKPFTVLQWLGPKSIPMTSGGVSGGENSGEAKGTAGFLFWENSEGFNFKSIESLVSGTQIGSGSADDKDMYTYTYSPITKAAESNDFNIIQYDIDKNIDLLKSLRVGMYSNKTYFYDLYTGSMDIYQYKLYEQVKGRLGTEDSISFSETFGQGWSRIMVRASDRGVLSKSGVTQDSGRDVADMAKSSSRYNLLFTQALNMTVPLNINLKSGDCINALFPLTGPGQKKGFDSKKSGRYLIYQLRHHFESSQMVTSLKLIRDSYGLYGKNQE